MYPGGMRLAPLAAFVAAGLLMPALARADLGPPQSCPDGTHHEYHMGRHCVRNGYHLDHSGSEVADDPDAAPPPRGSDSAAPDEPAPTPPSHACACGVAGRDDARGGAALALAFAVALAAGAGARRRAR
jgi:hypothetical protein